LKILKSIKIQTKTALIFLFNFNFRTKGVINLKRKDLQNKSCCILRQTLETTQWIRNMRNRKEKWCWFVVFGVSCFVV